MNILTDSKLTCISNSVIDAYLICINLFDGNIFFANMTSSALFHFGVVSGGLWQLLVELWRSVEAVACALRPIIRWCSLRRDKHCNSAVLDQAFCFILVCTIGYTVYIKGVFFVLMRIQLMRHHKS